MQADVLILDDNSDLRDVLASVIESQLKVLCKTYASYSDFQNDAIQVLKSRVAVLDIELGAKKESGMDAYRWLKLNKYPGHIFFLTGHAQSNPLVQEAVKSGAIVWEKPTSSNTIVLAVKDILTSASLSEIKNEN
jgi:FixJ family two-component response regulator